MNLVTSYLKKNPCYGYNLKAKELYDSSQDKRYWTFQCRGPQGGMLHSVGCAQPSAQVFITGWNKESYTNSCVHGIIDANTGTAYQLLPWNYRGWHGGGASNNTHIGVEMCESKYIKYLVPGDPGYSPGKFVILDSEKAKADCKRAYDTAVELFAMLAQKYKWNVDTDIISHKEGYAKNIASNHGDPEHYWQQLGMPCTMNSFRAAVKAKLAKLNNPFVDIKEGSYSYQAILRCFERGLMVGTSENHFSPKDPVTREQAAVIIDRLISYLDEKGGG